MNNDELQAEVDDFVKHVGAPSFKEAVDVLLRTKQQDEDKISEMFEIIKSTGVTNSKLAAEIAELKAERDRLLQERDDALELRDAAQRGREVAITERRACHDLYDQILVLCGYDPKGGYPGIVGAVDKTLATLRAELEAKQKVAFEAQNAAIAITAELEAARKEIAKRDASIDFLKREYADVVKVAQSHAKQRDTALAAKDAAEKALNRAFWVMEAQAEAEEPIGSAEFWQAEAGKIAAVLPAALTPAPTQEPPAGGVTISTAE